MIVHRAYVAAKTHFGGEAGRTLCATRFGEYALPKVSWATAQRKTNRLDLKGRGGIAGARSFGFVGEMPMRPSASTAPPVLRDLDREIRRADG
jgi:hypothetical protein